MSDTPGIDPSRPPSGEGCADCETANGWWFHLRRCAQCGRIGCCDDSLGRHATAHARESGHPVVQSFEPGEKWFYSYATDSMVRGPSLAPPDSHPTDQTAPGPQDRVPDDWQEILIRHRGDG